MWCNLLSYGSASFDVPQLLQLTFTSIEREKQLAGEHSRSVSTSTIGVKITWLFCLFLLTAVPASSTVQQTTAGKMILIRTIGTQKSSL